MPFFINKIEAYLGYTSGLFVFFYDFIIALCLLVVLCFASFQIQDEEADEVGGVPEPKGQLLPEVSTFQWRVNWAQMQSRSGKDPV